MTSDQVRAEPLAPSLPWPVLLVLAAATFVTVTAEMTPSGVLADVSSGLGVPTSTGGLLVTVWATTIVRTSVPLVRATSRLGRRDVLVGALAAVAVGNAVTALAPDLGTALASRVVAAAAHGVFWSVVVATVVTLVPPDRLGRALAVVLAGPTVAGLVGLPGGAALATLVGWRVVFALLAVLVVGVAAAVAVLLPRLPSRGTGRTSAASAPGGSLRPVLLVAGAGALALVGHFAVFTYLVVVAVEIGGVGEGGVPAVLLAVGVGGVVGVLLAGPLSDRAPTAALPATTAAFAVTLLLVGSTPGPGWFLAVATVWGVLVGVLPVALQTRVMRVATDPDLAGSVLTTVLNGGLAIGAALGSVLLATAGPGALAPVGAAAVVVALLPLALAGGVGRRADVVPPA